MKITKKMVEYWYGNYILPNDVIKDIVDLANEDYNVKFNEWTQRYQAKNLGE